MGPLKIVLVQMEGDRPPAEEDENDPSAIELGTLMEKGLQELGAETDGSAQGPGFAMRGTWNSIRFLIHVTRDPNDRGIIALIEVQKKKSSWFGKKSDDDGTELT